MKFDNKFEKLEKDFVDLLKSSFLSWEQIKQKKKVIGVYFVYLKDKIIYIGSTNNFNVRFGTDLLYKSTHTLHNKLLKEGNLSVNVKKFIKNKYKYKIKECEDKLEAEALEHFAIWSIKPEYNKNIYITKK